MHLIKQNFKIILISIFALGLFAIFSWSYIGETTFDDAFMFIRYANNFLSGYGFSWNKEALPTYGCTSLLYLFFITFLKWLLPYSAAQILTGASLFFTILSFIILVILSRLLFSESKNSHFLISIMPISLIFLSSIYAFHSTTGMETTMAFCINVIFILFSHLYSRNEIKQYWIASLFFGYLSYLARPDNGIYFILFPCLLWHLQKIPKKQIAKYICASMIIVFADAFIKNYYFGSIVPLSFYVKKSGFYIGYSELNAWNPAVYLLDFLQAVFPYAILTIAAINKDNYQRIFILFLPVILTFIYFWQTPQIMGFGARFLFPSIPFCLFIGIYSFKQIGFENLNHIGFLKIRAVFVFTLLIFCFSTNIQWKMGELWLKTRSKPQISNFKSLYKNGTSEIPILERWAGLTLFSQFLTDLNEKITLCATEYGYVGALNPEIKIIDPLGLHNTSAAKNGFSYDLISSGFPDLIQLPHEHYTLMNYKILSNKEFQENYIFIPKIFNYGLGIRKKSKFFNKICSLIQVYSKQIYDKNFVLKDYLATF